MSKGIVDFSVFRKRFSARNSEFSSLRFTIYYNHVSSDNLVAHGMIFVILNCYSVIAVSFSLIKADIVRLLKEEMKKNLTRAFLFFFMLRLESFTRI